MEVVKPPQHLRSSGASSAAGKAELAVLLHHRTQGQGVEGVHLLGVASALRSLGCRVDIASPPWVSVGESPASTAAPRRRAPSWKRLSEVLPEAVFEVMELLYNVYCFIRLRRRLRSASYGFIYERYALFNIAGVLAAGRSNTPLLLEVNYTADSPLYRKRIRLLAPLARATERFVFRRASGFLAISTPLQVELQRAGVPPHRIALTPNAADPGAFHPGISGASVRARLGLGERPILGFVGGFYPWHGVGMILDALGAIQASVPDVSALLIGDGPLRATLERRAEAEGLADRIRFVGWISHDALPEYIAAFDIALMPDSNEYGSPMKVFEYMAMEKPVVAPRLGPLEDAIIDGEVGLLFPRGEAQGLGNAILTLLLDKARRLELGKKARRHVIEHHTWATNARAVLELYRGIPTSRQEP
jgi:glycosyltransferase involved in cell wall biosynthesis